MRIVSLIIPSSPVMSGIAIFSVIGYCNMSVLAGRGKMKPNDSATH